ncbi:hypothetical protein LIER_00845 [Lithospermum erythrorhizon]|uniref:Uncharacterized protein n=1 Tax=Lithospermum erythrorhizon TaxID=34254 RepID=A0AAV3NK18_LITER
MESSPEVAPAEIFSFLQQVIEAPADSIVVPDGATLSVFQYFENVRYFLVSVEEMGLPSFEASDLEKNMLVLFIYVMIGFACGIRKDHGSKIEMSTQSKNY